MIEGNQEYFPQDNHMVFNHAIGTVGNPEGQELFDHFMEACSKLSTCTDSTLWIDLSVFRFVANR